MEQLERILSRPVAKPYRSGKIQDSGDFHLNDDGLLDFGPNDIESEHTAGLPFAKPLLTAPQTPKTGPHSGDGT